MLIKIKESFIFLWTPTQKVLFQYQEIFFGVFSVGILVGLYFIFSRDQNKSTQKQLDVYLSKNFSPYEIGLMYERYIGYIYETSGYQVIYNGALNGYEDLGRDLIATQGNQVLIIQTKCWAKFKQITERVIYQLYGSTVHYQKSNSNKDIVVTPVLVTTAQVSVNAFHAAKLLGVEIRQENLRLNYPMIKCCHVNQGQTKAYFLPFDQGYDSLAMNFSQGDKYVNKVSEAVGLGFERNM